MAQPTLSGVHHVLVPVSDLAEAEAWWARAFFAERLPELDHVDQDGRLFAVIVRLPGAAPVVQLRLDDELAHHTSGYGPVAFTVKDRGDLDRWARHFDQVGVAHSPTRAGMIGEVFDVTTLYGLVARLYTA